MKEVRGVVYVCVWCLGSRGVKCHWSHHLMCCVLKIIVGNMFNDTGALCVELGSVKRALKYG